VKIITNMGAAILSAPHARRQRRARFGLSGLKLRRFPAG
jgi:hypothetical protein